MKRKLLNNFWAGATLYLAAIGASAAIPASAQPANARSERKERPVLAKPEKTTIDPNASVSDVVVLKFREGTGIRLRDGGWNAPLGARSPDERRLLQRGNLDETQVLVELGAANDLLQGNANLAAARLFTRPEDELDLEKQIGEENGDEELADLNLYFHVFVANGRVEDTERVIDQLNALKIVEIAYPQPIYQLAQVTTPDFTGQQSYLDASSVTTPGSNGLDSRYAWTLPGGNGLNTRVIDVEYDWRDGHEDLPSLFHVSGVREGSLPKRDHGSAVLGVLAGVENSIGITGMASRAMVGISHPLRVGFPCPPCIVDDVADAVNRAAGQLPAGDVILIEVHVPGPTGTLTCDTTCLNCAQFGYVPVEWNQAEYDAIRTATFTSQIVVVEAAGNGQMNLDDSRYNRVFDRTFRDSWAIMVGAGLSNSRAPWCWSDAGSRVDVQGWGDSVVTTGYGDLFGITQGLPETRWYKAGFNGTSSGSAIIAGAVAQVEGVRRTRGITLLNSPMMRGLLQQTGVAQATGRNIGPLPNLRDAIALYIDGGTSETFRVGIPAQPFRTIVEGVGAAWSQAQLRITARNYPEVLTIDRPMFLMSRGGTVTIGQ